MEIAGDIDVVLDNDLYEINNELNLERTYRVIPRRDHYNFWSDREFFNRFRLSKPSVGILFNEIEGYLQHRTQRNLDRAITPMNQLLLSLRFLATGDFYITLGDFAGIHKSTAGKIVNKVLTAICRLRPNYIDFPRNEDELQNISTQFYTVARFPRIIGALDCTHIKLQSPGGENAEIFRNRKGYFSLNVQAICDKDNRFLNVVCRWPGSSHDAHIFNNSAVRMLFENNEMGNFLLLGDSGYPLRRYLLTPIENPQNDAEILYNEAQIRTRNVIERTFGIWKRRFPILTIGIRAKLELSQKIIVACAILHNIACEQNEENFDGDVEDIEVQLQNHEQHNDGINARVNMIDYFRNLINQGVQ